MTAPDVRVAILRCFEGPRHDKLELIWDCIAEYCRDRVVLDVHPNMRPMVRHDQALEMLWRKLKDAPERYLLITEFDFLPNLRKNLWLPTGLLSKVYPVMAAQHAWRNAATRALEPHEYPGAWYILIDKENVPDLTGAFLPGPEPRTDPANCLFDHTSGKMAKIKVDCYPKAYGVGYFLGFHSFFSRHFNDPPEGRVAGFPLKDIQEGHDRLVDNWLTVQDPGFLRLLAKRAPEKADA